MTVLTRRRTDADLPALGEALLEQQAASGYPQRDPLPMSAEEFIVRTGELAAWVAEVDGRPIGHIAVLAPPAPETAAPGYAHVVRTWMHAHGRTHESIGEVGVFFTATHARGTGAGRALLETALAHLHDHDLAPCLEVLPTGAAVELYRRTGWREVAAVRPEWLADDAPDVIAMVLPIPRGTDGRGDPDPVTEAPTPCPSADGGR